MIRAAVLAVVPILAACADEAGTPVARGFGEATDANRRAMSGRTAYVAGLGERFAASVPSTVTFPFDSAALTPRAQADLRQQASFMRHFPELRFSVYGHTDLIGSAAYNETLGRRRAREVVAYLGRLGVSPDRLAALVSYGETQPLVPLEAPVQRNRRTVTEVAGLVRSHPRVLNGKYAGIVFREYVQSATPLPSQAVPPERSTR